MVWKMTLAIRTLNQANDHMRFPQPDQYCYFPSYRHCLKNYHFKLTPSQELDHDTRSWMEATFTNRTKTQNYRRNRKIPK